MKELLGCEGYKFGWCGLVTLSRSVCVCGGKRFLKSASIVFSVKPCEHLRCVFSLQGPLHRRSVQAK